MESTGFTDSSPMHSSILKTFSTNGGNDKIIYDPRVNEFILLNKINYHRLLSIIGTIKPSFLQPETKHCIENPCLYSLLKKGYFITEPLTRRINTNYDFIEDLVNQGFTDSSAAGGLTLEMTDQCNLRCGYCPFTLGLRSVGRQNRVNASQSWACKMNVIQRVSTDFRGVFPAERSALEA